ncbi:anti-sigma factor [Hyphococcus flavus]|uniref:Anti-sigma factor n=1 Tax=Hyphococcus flavus TaxID=1866326 RepID=A0AAF0CEZ3_9PROT|nr:anti-sigma factor [Hyphococcus flavus]WDI31991.1 anti-sigma factor [Hyphococcus flavus]
MSESGETYDDSILAGEYVLGVLSSEAHVQAERRIETDAAFAASVRFWEAQLGNLAEEIEPHEAPTLLKQRIEETLFAQSAAKSSLWSSLPFWRFSTGAMAALAVLSVVYVFSVQQPSVPPSPAFVATILPADAAPVFVAEIDGTLTAIRIQDAAIEIAEGQSAELWLIPEDGTPRSLGLIGAEGDDLVHIPALLRDLINAGAALAVSIEPQGGSPSGAPTGPVIGIGLLKKI